MERGRLPEGFAVLGVAVLVDGELPRLAGWCGIVGGIAFAGGFLGTRRRDLSTRRPGHLYPGLLGVLLLLA